MLTVEERCDLVVCHATHCGTICSITLCAFWGSPRAPSPTPVALPPLHALTLHVEAMCDVDMHRMSWHCACVCVRACEHGHGRLCHNMLSECGWCMYKSAVILCMSCYFCSDFGGDSRFLRTKVQAAAAAAAAWYDGSRGDAQQSCIVQQDVLEADARYCFIFWSTADDAAMIQAYACKHWTDLCLISFCICCCVACCMCWHVSIIVVAVWLPLTWGKSRLHTSTACVCIKGTANADYQFWSDAIYWKGLCNACLLQHDNSVAFDCLLPWPDSSKL